MSWLSAVAPILGGLFGKKKKDPTPAQNILSQAQGARQAADQYGFNPLTMLQYGNPGGAIGGGGEPPLASSLLLSGALDPLVDEISGEAAQQREANQLALDLARIKLDQARSGVALMDAGTGPQTLGQRPARAAAVNGNLQEPFTTAGATPGTALSPGRIGQEEPVLNSSGFWEMNNAFTGGDVAIYGEGPEGGIDEVVIAAMQAAPQIAGNWASVIGGKIGNKAFGTDAFTDVHWTDAFKADTWNRPFFSQDTIAQHEAKRKSRNDAARLDFMKNHYPTYLD